MKKIFTITSVVALGLLVTFACKKSTTTTPATTSTSSTTGTNTNVTSLTIDGSAVSGITVQGGPNSTEYQLYGSNPNTLYPEIELTFPGTSVPSGTYAISPSNISVAPAAGHCYFVDVAGFSAGSTYTANSGVVTVTAGTPSNTAVFNGIVCTGTSGSHTITGVFKF